MHLFGGSKGPHLADFKAHRERGFVELAWEVRSEVGLRCRVLRSKRSFAATPWALPGNGQTVVMEGTATHTRDVQIDEGIPYFYTVFVRDAQGEWQRQAKAKLKPHRRLRWLHAAHAGSAFEADLAGDARQRSRDAAEVLVQRLGPGPRR